MTTLLLDTQTIFWYAENHPDIGRNTRRLVSGAISRQATSISAISFCELAFLALRGRIAIKAASIRVWRSEVLNAGIKEIPVTGETAITAMELTDFHGDPADRLITATAIRHGAVLVTSDRKILAWQGQLRRADARL